MKPGVSVITIGVEDLQKSLRCYRDGLGFPVEEIEKAMKICLLVYEVCLP